MQNDFDGSSIVVGLKQSLKAVEAGEAARAFVAEDADSYVKKPFIAACEQYGVAIEYYPTCQQLGQACGIDVGAAVAIVKKG